MFRALNFVIALEYRKQLSVAEASINKRKPISLPPELSQFNDDLILKIKPSKRDKREGVPVA